MIWLLASWTTASAQSLQIEVADPSVSTVLLACDDGERRADVVDGIAAFMRAPQGCRVHLLQEVGHIDAPGRWRCTDTRCALVDVDHRPVSDADGRINVIANTDLPASASFELSCAGGHRQRQRIAQNVAVFDDVPASDCTLLLKGGVPAKFQPMTWGTYTCGLSGSAMICNRR